MPLPTDQIQRIAGLELNALRATEVLGDAYEKIRVASSGTPVYDLNGEPRTAFPSSRCSSSTRAGKS